MVHRNESTGAEEHGVAIETAEPLQFAIPFTTVEQVRVSIAQIERLCRGLHATVHVIRVCLVPYILPLATPPVQPLTLLHQMAGLSTELPLVLDVRLGREFVPCLLSGLPENAIFVLTAKTRWIWGRERQIARQLRRAGRHVCLFKEGK